MLDPTSIPDVEREELLARYVFSRSHISRITQRVKAGAFMPPANLEFSVTRHHDATEAEIGTVGRNVAAETEGLCMVGATRLGPLTRVRNEKLEAIQLIFLNNSSSASDRVSVVSSSITIGKTDKYV